MDTAFKQQSLKIAAYKTACGVEIAPKLLASCLLPLAVVFVALYSGLYLSLCYNIVITF